MTRPNRFTQDQLPADAPRAIIYLRVSTKRQTVLNQFRQLRKAAAYHGWRIVEVVRDHRTGKNTHRPGFQYLREQLARKRRRFDVLMVWSISRLGRSAKEMSAFLVDEVQPSGVQLFSHKESIDTRTAAGRLVYNILSSIYEFEVEHNAEKILSGLDRARAQGKKLGRPNVEDKDPELTERVLTLRAAGHAIKTVAKLAGCGVGTVYRILEANPQEESA